MKILVPHGYGLGAREVSALRRLSRQSLEIIADELHEPFSRTTVLRILRSPDPERALADQISYEVARAVRVYNEVRAAGMGDVAYDEWANQQEGLCGFFKKIKKKIKAVAKKVAAVPKKVVKIHKKVAKKVVDVHKKVAKKAVTITKNTAKNVAQFQKRAIKKVGKAIKPYIPIILSVAGAVLAPFTGGASLAAAAALSAAYTLAMKAKQARAAKKAGRAEAAAIAAEVSAAEADLNRQLNDLFTGNQGVFAAAGITQAQWSGMSIEQRLAVVERINSGNMPSSQENATNAAEAQGQAPPTQTQTWQQAIQNSPILQQWQSAAGDADAAAEGYQAPTGTYDVYVEGQKVGSAGTLDEASDILYKNSKSGDRVEITLDGRSLGLKVVSRDAGILSIPSDQADAVRSMSRADVDALISRASQKAGAADPSSESDGGISPMWLLAIPAAAFLAVKAKVA